jgi:hypothetical protein
VKLVKKILGENEIESVLQRLDRLTLDEARTTAMQTLEIVHRLVQNMSVVIDGAATLPHFEVRSLLIITPTDGKASADVILDALSMLG